MGGQPTQVDVLPSATQRLLQVMATTSKTAGVRSHAVEATSAKTTFSIRVSHLQVGRGTARTIVGGNKTTSRACSMPIPTRTLNAQHSQAPSLTVEIGIAHV